MILERRVVVQQLLTGVFWEVVVRLRRHERQHGWTSRFVNLGNLARLLFFSICRARECGWLLAAATSSEDGEMRDPVLPVALFFTLWTGNHCRSRSTAVDAPEHSRAVGGALCKYRKTVVRTFRVSLRHDTFLLVPCCQRVGRSHESVGENFEFHRDELVGSLHCVSAVFPRVVMCDRCACCT